MIKIYFFNFKKGYLLNININDIIMKEKILFTII